MGTGRFDGIHDWQLISCQGREEEILGKIVSSTGRLVEGGRLQKVESVYWSASVEVSSLLLKSVWICIKVCLVQYYGIVYLERVALKREILIFW